MPNLASIISNLDTNDVKKAKFSAIKMAVGPNGPNPPRPPLRMIAFDDNDSSK